jgi:hypothetical protein
MDVALRPDSDDVAQKQNLCEPLGCISTGFPCVLPEEVTRNDLVFLSADGY